MKRLARAERITKKGNTIRFVRFFADYPVTSLTNTWLNLGTGGFVGDRKAYVVQTDTRVIERCMLMTTDPGDLVVDPTCGSGTTAYVAEQWGRRWITIDTSRVAVSIARQRLLTGKFDYFRLKDEDKSVVGNFVYESVPHITLKSIAQNTALDTIFVRHDPILQQKLQVCNTALKTVDKDIRAILAAKLAGKQRNEGRRSITEADRRRWDLPDKGNSWEHWQVPFDIDEVWPRELIKAVTEYRKAWRQKMDEVDACIAASAEQEELVDQPQVVKGIVRVSGPFTVEAVQPPEMSLGDVLAIGDPADAGKFGGSPDAVGPTFTMRPVQAGVGETARDLTAYLDKMVKLLRLDGVRFPNNKQMKFTHLEPIFETRSAQGFHAEGRWAPQGGKDEDASANTVGVVIGPQYGPVTAKMIEDLIKPASRCYDDLVIAGFSFTGEAQAIINENPHPKLRVHIAHIRPDVNPGMDGLLKEQPGAQLFTVFGQPRITVGGPDQSGEYTVEMEGVDIYNPVDNSITPTGADKVAAWFLDGDYDGRTFCITQAFFPDRSAWEKLARALNGIDGLIDAERFEALSGTTSLPFPKGKHARVAVKVIDPRGNEVMSVHALD